MNYKGFVFKQIKKFNLRLLIFSIILMCAAGFIASRFPNYLHNLKDGPFNLDIKKLSSIRDADSVNEYYVKVKGQKVYTLIKDAGFLLLDTGDRLLVIKGTEYADSLEFTGKLKNLSSEDKEKFIGALSKKVDISKFKSAFYPVMIEEGDIKSDMAIEIILFSLLLLIIIRNIVVLIKRNMNPLLHPSCKYLSSYGDAATMINTVDSEIERAQCETIKSTLLVTESWVISKKLFKLQFIPLSDVAWVYQKVTSHKVDYVIPAGKTYEMIIYTKDSQKHELKVKNGKSGEELINILKQNAPWVFAGYSVTLDEMWKKNRKEFMQEVEDRFKQAKEYGEETLNR